MTNAQLYVWCFVVALAFVCGTIVGARVIAPLLNARIARKANKILRDSGWTPPPYPGGVDGFTVLIATGWTPPGGAP